MRWLLPSARGKGSVSAPFSPQPFPLCSSAPAASEGSLADGGGRPQQRRAAPTRAASCRGTARARPAQPQQEPRASGSGGQRAEGAVPAGLTLGRPLGAGAHGDRLPPRTLHVDFSERCLAKQARQKQLFLILPANIFNHLFTLTKYASTFPILSVYKKNICFFKKIVNILRCIFT